MCVACDSDVFPFVFSWHQERIANTNDCLCVNECWMASADASKERVRTADVAECEPGGNADEHAAGANFEALCLPDAVLAGVRACGYTRPSPVQRAAIPPALAGADCIVQAKSGTGKTCAFGVVALASVLAGTRKRCRAVVIEPTRELAAQTAESITALGACVPQLGVALFIGGLSLAADMRTAQHGRTDIVVGTPGRTADVLCARRALDVAAVALLVVDEADRIEGDAPLRADVHRIARALHSPSLQTLAFSATFTPPIIRALASMMRNPRLITPHGNVTLSAVVGGEEKEGGEAKAGSSVSSSAGVKTDDNASMTRDVGDIDNAKAISLLGVSHFVVEVGESDGASTAQQQTLTREETPQERAIAAFEAKARALAALLDGTAFNQCLVFCNSKQWACLLSEWLCERGWRSAFISGGTALPQRARLAVLDAARHFQLRVLVATDLVARGVDLARVNVVVNFDLPASAPASTEHTALHTYFHRAGRTGRYGTLGVVLSLCDRRAPADAAFVAQLEAFLRRPLQRLDVAHGERVPAALYAHTMESRAEQEALSEFQTARALAVGARNSAAAADARSLGALVHTLRSEASAPPPASPPSKRQRKSRKSENGHPPLPHESPLQQQQQQCWASLPGTSVVPPFFPQIPWSLL